MNKNIQKAGHKLEGFNFYNPNKGFFDDYYENTCILECITVRASYRRPKRVPFSDWKQIKAKVSRSLCLTGFRICLQNKTLTQAASNSHRPVRPRHKVNANSATMWEVKMESAAALLA